MPPIGIIDSGAGGLTVLARLVELLPHQPFLYLADAAYCPYGPRAYTEIRHRLAHLSNHLIAQGCLAIVVACNTATAAAIDHLRAFYTIPFVGMEPAVKPAALHSDTGQIAVLATVGTFQGELFKRTVAQYSTRAEIRYLVGEKLVEIVENGQYEDQSTYSHVRGLLNPLLQYRIDHLVLGCTHYPFLRRALAAALPPFVKLVDPAPAVAKQVRRVLSQLDSCSVQPSREVPAIQLFSTGNHSKLLAHYQYYMNLIGVEHSTPIACVEHIDL